MYIDSLKLINFRNYDLLNIEFSPDVNFITGNNGSGKTNIIESISLLSNLKSFKNIHDSDLVRWKNDSFYCLSKISDSDYNKFEVAYSLSNSKKKRFKIDSNEIKKASEYYGKLLSVFFLPEDINIINGSPEIKRRYFDSVISKIYPGYINDLNDFRTILSSRNNLLKKIRESSANLKSIDIWNKLFSEKYSKIYSIRKSFITDFNLIYHLVYGKISGDEFVPRIKYESNIFSSEIDSISKLLNSRQQIDLKKGICTIGPQKDLYSFVNDEDIDFKQFASQGQKRTASIALKAAEFNIIHKITNNKSIILVDDIFSELDNFRRNNMLSFLERKGQLIFTMVDFDILDLKKNDCYRKFNVLDNKIYSI